MIKTVIPQETQKNETRVAGTPETVRKLTSLGLSVFVEKGAGAQAFFSDADYQAAGATLAEGPALFDKADLVLTVNGVPSEVLGNLSPEAVVIGLLGGHDATSRFPSPLRAFSLELLPRISRAQAMDVLSSQSTVSGYWAVIEAARRLPFLFPLLMTAAGTSAPARVLVLGAGVAGLQAIATAKRLGAVVFALDVRAAAKEQVESLGAQFVVVPSESEGDDKSGYAREMGQDYQVRQAEKLKSLLPSIDCIIGTALIPGKQAPRIIDEDMVSLLKPGSVIIDLAAGAGGNCGLTQGNTTFTTDGGVTIVGEANAPSHYPQDASALYARNVLNFVKLLVSEDGSLKDNASDALLEATCLGTPSV